MFSFLDISHESESFETVKAQKFFQLIFINIDAETLTAIYFQFNG